MRRILDELRVRSTTGKYVALGATLAQKPRLMHCRNAIAEAIKRFRDTVVEALGERGLRCGRQDVILSGGPGYRLAERIVVKDGGHLG